MSDSLSTRKRIYAALSYVALVVLAIFFIGPLLFMFTTSAKNDELTLQRELGGISAFLPACATRQPNPETNPDEIGTSRPPLVRAEGETDQQFRARQVARMCETGIQNFADMNARVNYWRALFNSTLVVTITVVLGLLVNSMFAYAIARIKFWGREFLITGVISLIIIPFSAVAIPLFLMVVRQFGWSDSYQALIFPFIASAFSIYLFYQFFISLPKELEEAAFVDGADRFRTYWQIVLPLSGPVFATVTVLQFLALWANLLWPVMVVRGLDSPVATLPYVMQTFFGQAPRQWGDVMAFALCTTLPTLLLFLFFQRWFVRSVVSSGVKG
jgi:multiple sugar transport system permease protein